MGKIPPNALILPDIEPRSFQVGGMEHTDTTKILFPEASCLDYMPTYETQAMLYFDTYGCVSHSFLNAVEINIRRAIAEYSLDNRQWLMNFMYDDNGEPNFADRDLVVLSGTVHGSGNSGNQVLTRAQRIGLIAERMASWNPKDRDPEKNNVEEYFAYARTENANELAEEWNKRFKIIGTWVYVKDENALKEAMKTGVVQIYVNAWYKNSDGKYYNPNDNYTHATVALDFNDIKTLDTYPPEIKELSSWDDIHVWALKINIIEKNHMEKPQIENNTLLQLVEGNGGFGMFLDGKIYVDDTAKILASVIMRNNGKLDGKIRALTQEQWDLFEKRNLKNETL